MRFVLFLIVLFVLTLIVLYVIGDSRAPQTRLIEQEIELNGRE